MHIRRYAVLAAFAALLSVAVVPSAHAVDRDQSIARGRIWLNYARSVDPSTGVVLATGVPYSQTRFAFESGAPGATSKTGYRTDCSGFVSMCWDLEDAYGRPMSYSTYGFATATSKFVRISKNQLMPGDLMLKSTVWGAAQGDAHAILFTGWTDSTKTSYWALEQTSGSNFTGTIYRVRPWGERYYFPYRYIGIEDDFHDCQTRVLGNDRYSTGAEAAKVSFPATMTAVASNGTTKTVSTTVSTLVVASGANWPDALGGAALAGAVHGPLLLTAPTSLPAATREQIARLKPATVYVLGGTASVSNGVIKDIASLGPNVVRIGASNRYDEAAAVARVAMAVSRATTTAVDTAYIATGKTFPDALAVSPIAAKTGRPVLLTEPGRLSAGAAATIRDLGIKHVVILGGTASVSGAVEQSLRATGATVERIAASNRYNTALAIAEHGEQLGVGLGWENVGIASGAVFPDALSGGCAQGQSASLLVLTPSGSLDPGVAAKLAEHRPRMVRIYGGFVTIPQQTRQAVADVVRSVQ